LDAPSLFGLLGRAYPQLDWAPQAWRARHTFQELSLDPEMGYFCNLSVTDDAMRKRLFSPELRGLFQAIMPLKWCVSIGTNAPDRDPIAIAHT